MYVHQPFWYLLTPCPLLKQSLALKTPKNTEEDPNDPDPDEGEN